MNAGKATTATIRRRVGGVVLGLGVLLLVCDLLGQTALGRYASRPPRDWERFDPALAAATPSLEALHASAGGERLATLPPERRLEALFDVVTRRFTHGGETRHTVFRNWLAWSAGHVYPAAGYLREPATVLRFGHSAWCSEQSAVFAALAERVGVSARLVWLDGHVVAEAEYEGGWHVWDPDLEVVPRDPGGAVVSVQAIATRPVLVDANYGERGAAKVEQLQAIFGSATNHRYEDRPAAGRARRFERATERLKWAGPLLLIGSGVVLLGRPATRRATGGAVAPGRHPSGA